MSTSYTVFDQIAARYEAWYETPEGRRVDRLEKAALRWLIQDLDVQHVLEIGCGTGHFSRWLQDQGLNVVGLDLSASMLGQAQARDGLAWVRGDAHRLPFADGSFDLSFLITTLEFLPQPQVALAEAMRVARRGLILGVLNRWSLLGLRRRLAGLWRRTTYDTARFYGVRGLKRLLRSVAGNRPMRLIWHTTLFPRWGPWSDAILPVPWGGFIAMAWLYGPEGRKESRPEPFELAVRGRRAGHDWEEKRKMSGLCLQTDRGGEAR